MSFAQVQPVLNSKVRALCARPYEGHPKGCPNVGQRDTCPPKARLLAELLDLDRPVFAVWSVFDLGVHVERMRATHPGWSERQLRCCLYWQAGARKVLRAEIQAFLRDRGASAHPEPRIRAASSSMVWWDPPFSDWPPQPWLRVLTCPEACGVDVTATMKRIGIELQWPPKTLAYQVALVGTEFDKIAQELAREKRQQQSQPAQLGLL